MHNIRWICFRVRKTEETFGFHRFSLILVGIFEEKTLIVKLIDIEISKVGGSSGTNYKNNFWKFKGFIKFSVSIQGVNFGRIEVDRNQSYDPEDQRYFLFITNGETILEYKLSL